MSDKLVLFMQGKKITEMQLKDGKNKRKLKNRGIKETKLTTLTKIDKPKADDHKRVRKLGRDES